MLLARRMRTSFVACLSLASFAWACSSEENASSRAAQVSPDGGSSADGSHSAGPDASKPRSDGSRGGAAGSADGDAAACPFKPGKPPDFSIELTGEVGYDGAVTVQSVDAGALALVWSGEGGRAEAKLGGNQTALPSGTRLWASLSQHTFHANPFNSTTLSSSMIRASERGPVLAETVRAFIPSNPSSRPFLGVTVSFEQLCTRHEITNLVTGESCATTDLYSVTLHGDSDVALSADAENQVTIAGTRYVVWLEEAFVDAATGICAEGDWAPTPGLVIAGRVVNYEAVLRPVSGDAAAEASP